MLEIGGSNLPAGHADLQIEVSIPSRSILFRIVHCDAREDSGDSTDHGAGDGPGRARNSAHRSASEGAGQPSLGLVCSALAAAGRQFFLGLVHGNAPSKG
jgi:hypothetical protein